MAVRGDVLLPNFQRSFVWKPQQTAHYLHALLENRPTGIFLILQAERPLPFACRGLHGANLEPGRNGGAKAGDWELVLDGQQRLTSLWGALSGAAPKRYLIRVKDLLHGNLEVKQVAWRSHSWSNPPKMCRENWVPADILWTEPSTDADADGSSTPQASFKMKQWCAQAVGDEWADLYETVGKLRERLVIAPRLQYCLLSRDTERDTAIDIFINVNRSAVKLKEVDIAVAIAEADHGVDLRARVEEYIGRSTEVEHYFSAAPRKTIPEVAEWMLKVACLRVRTEKQPDGLPPSAAHYPSAVEHLFGPGVREDEGESRAVSLGADLDAALRFVAARGGSTKRTLPAWPPVHVIAALQEDVRQLGSAPKKDFESLLSAYLWRSFFTERYQMLANVRLLEDFRELRRYLHAFAAWRTSGGAKPSLSVPALDNTEYPLPSISQLRRAGWIGGVSRLGRAIAALAMQGSPLDWATGDQLDPDRVRELERAGKLERRKVFPSTLFEPHVGREVDLGLNGILLPKNSFKPCDPSDLLSVIREHQPGVDELELRTRVHSHLVPWLALAREGAAPGYRYPRFLKARAQDVAMKIGEVTSF
ncbi:GmrSD restriction endonuclease domain-containing protein [Candidatus Palauibacter sp.]|uniref:DUF262 domain-containing protein n=1 Tax=Candidatus Palauibacter sp. TaxID=3101350 RepID=UPI003B0124D8